MKLKGGYVISKIWGSPADAVADVADGATVMIGGFGGSGLPTALIAALRDTGSTGLRIVSNNVGGTDHGVGVLIANRQVAKVTCSFPIGRSRVRLQDDFWEQYDSGLLEVEVLPQGSLAEGIRSAGAGIPAFYTPAGVGTELGEGKELREFDGRPYLLQPAIGADFALVKARMGDRLGNLCYRKAMRNFNPMMSAAAAVTVAQVARVGEAGALNPEQVDTPGVYVQRVVAVPEDRPEPQSDVEVS